MMLRMTKDLAVVSIMLSGLACGCGSNDVDTCYSPMANVSTANQAGAKGCACDPAVDQAVCVEGKALFCDYGHWSFGYDGPCMPGPDAGSSPDLTSPDVSDADTQPLSCGTPSCCVPLAFDPSRVYVDRNSDGARMGMVLSLDALPSSWWEIDVDVLLPSGTSVACTTSPRAPVDAKTVTLFCPTVALDALPACDSTITLELNPRSSTYPDSTGTHALCAGTGGRQIKVSVPVTCPDGCGTPSNGRSCNVLGRTCNYTTMAYGGGGGTSTASLPCSCLWNDLLNALAWSCAVP